jgi:TetR/AcrR family transcriptional repressor of lmrAB and yxaGH operons
MIDSAVVLLGRDGYGSTSFSAVLEHSGAPRGSIYHHFPGGKDELIDAAVDRVTERTLAGLATLTGRPAETIAEAFARGWRRILEADDCRSGCPIMAVATAADVEPALGRAVERAFARWRSALADTLVAGGVAEERAPDVAAFLLAAYEGALLLARAQRSLAVFDAVDAQIRRAALSG